ncbi:hypothetical protein LG290_04525 [Halomonas sediminis]
MRGVHRPLLASQLFVQNLDHSAYNRAIDGKIEKPVFMDRRSYDHVTYYQNDTQEIVSTKVSATGNVYDLWCDPRGDLCTFTDSDGTNYKLSREYLPQHIPIAADTSDCMQEVCYDENMEVIGLNPDHHLYR